MNRIEACEMWILRRIESMDRSSMDSGSARQRKHVKEAIKYNEIAKSVLFTTYFSKEQI